MRLMTLLILVTALAACAGHGAATSPVANAKTLGAGVKDYLRDHGDFCLAKFSWPITVTERARRAGSNDAIQMPVLERLGLVVSTVDPKNPTAKIYALTDEGRKFYIEKTKVTHGPVDVLVQHPGDLCAAKLKLDQVVSWQPIAYVDGHAQTTAKYTYTIAAAPAWAQDAELRQVFPWLDRILASEHHLQLEQLFSWSNNAWVAVVPGG